MSGARSPRPRPAGAVMPTPLGTPPSVRSITNASDPLNVRELRHRQLGRSWASSTARGAICQVRAMARYDAEEVSAVLSAYVLIQTEVGKVAHVAQAAGVPHRPVPLGVEPAVERSLFLTAEVVTRREDGVRVVDATYRLGSGRRQPLAYRSAYILAVDEVPFDTKLLRHESVHCVSDRLACRDVTLRDGGKSRIPGGTAPPRLPPEEHRRAATTPRRCTATPCSTTTVGAPDLRDLW